MKNIVLFLSVLFAIQGNSQSTCDSLEIVHVNVDAFFANQLNITLLNMNTQEIFDYPGFRVYDENDNLIGEEEVFFFGITGESTHSITFDNTAFPFVEGQEHLIKLELWTNFYAELACSFELNTVPVLSLEECIPISITFLEFSSEQVSYDWQLTDFWGNIIQDETLVFSENVGSITRNVCLDQSCFFLSASSSLDPDISTLYVNVVADVNFGFISSPLLDMSNDSTMLFSVWTDCSLINSEFEIQDSKFEIYPNPSSDFIQVSGINSDVFNFEVYDTAGRKVLSKEYNSSEQISIAPLGFGLYVIRLTQGDRVYNHRFFKQ